MAQALSGLFKPDPPQRVTLTGDGEIRAQFRHWQKRVLVLTIAGYAVFYFVGKNLSVARPVMGKELHFNKAVLGSFLTLHGLLYGLSKFLNGFMGDRSNARNLMVAGLAGSVLMNVLFGFSSTAVAFGIIWLFNGWFQGMGFPPCARLMTHWFSPRQLASKFSIWTTSHCIGGGLIVILCGYLVTASWRYCFWVPAGLALACAVLLYKKLPDTPPSVGLPEVEGTHEDPARQTDKEFRGLVMAKVFRNPWIWLISLSNFLSISFAAPRSIGGRRS